uniref:Uncharacterized protein n=1 Tax=Arundo donax TaxID=35708 RepID=A0A0A8Y797_ARUDO
MAGRPAAPLHLLCSGWRSSRGERNHAKLWVGG